jgi:4-alpha-glucanotransferase
LPKGVDVLDQLKELAHLYSVDSEYYDGLGVRHEPPDESLLMILRSLGADVANLTDLSGDLHERRAQLAKAIAEPVIVVWGDAPVIFTLNLPEPADDVRLDCTLVREDGKREVFSVEWRQGEWIDQKEFDGRNYQMRRFTLDVAVSSGYHTLRVEGSAVELECLVIAAPQSAFQSTAQRAWGNFLPVYALHTESSWGAGDLSDFEGFMNWTAELGGRFVGTLPLFASFLEEPFAPSPYAPVSRLFWNEFFADPTRAPNWSTCTGAHQLVSSDAFVEAIAKERARKLVDYRSQMALKARVFRELSRSFWKSRGEEDPDFRSFLEERPEVRDYAAFRAVLEGRHANWQEWPRRMRDGNLRSGDWSPEDLQYHLYVQWLIQRQMEALIESGRRHEMGLYLDLPLGVHPDGYDAWRSRTSFAAGISGGAPPDGFFTEGQQWGFPPLHPEGERRDHYQYLRSVLANLMRHTDMIRIDHAMSLQRLFWVPLGREAVEGTYVYYKMDELFALVVLESCRHDCVIVGEDLGTVTPELRRTMEDRGLYRMYVGQFELALEDDPPFREPQPRMVASLNTHDTPTATGFWFADDVELRKELGLLKGESLERERLGREAIREMVKGRLHIDEAAPSYQIQFDVLVRWLEFLAAGDVEFLQVTLEDLLQERSPQNVPGTYNEQPNWKRKARLSFEAFRRDPHVVETLKRLESLRRTDNEAVSSR